MLENGENEKIEVRSSLRNSWFSHRLEVEEKIKQVQDSMKGLFMTLGEEHSWWALSDYEHHRELSPEERAVYEAHQKWLKNIEENYLKDAQRMWFGPENHWGRREGGLKETLSYISHRACPQCGGFTEEDGDRETDGCSADWATVERSWSWCVGFGSETAYTGDCCSLKRRQAERDTDYARKCDIENYCEWLYLGGMSNIPKRLWSYDFGYMTFGIDSMLREKALLMVEQMCGIQSARWSTWVYPEQYRPTTGLFANFYHYMTDTHDEGCEHRSGCGWNTSSSRIVASGGY